MKAAGYLVRVDNLGRIVIPVRIRRSMELAPDSCLELFTEENKIIMQKYQESCVFCNAEDNLIEHGGKYICKTCLESIKKSVG
ncbi:MAG: AbrB/MazE/SpoVT family DNA-binding domain-containing protein [Ruminococcus sp.]|nr:AbrB/MazE/SpoVT family DNA-binding domain-containing protein [Ruminococcus sp.]